MNTNVNLIKKYLMREFANVDQIISYCYARGSYASKSDILIALQELNRFLDLNHRLVVKNDDNGIRYYIIKTLKHLPNVLYWYNNKAFKPKSDEYSIGYKDLSHSFLKPFHLHYTRIVNGACVKEGPVTKGNYLPIALTHFFQNQYLIAYNLETRDYQNLEWYSIIKCEPIEHNVSIDTVALMSEFKLTYQERFGLSKNYDNKIYTVRLKFTKPVGHYVQCYHWHHSQTFAEGIEEVFMSLSCALNLDLVKFVCNWLDDVEVLSPIILIDLVKKYAQKCNF